MKALTVLALLAALPAMGAGCQTVNASRVLGRDLSAAVPELSGLPPDSDLAPAPLVGVERVFRTEDVARIAKHYGLPPLGRAIEVCFVRKTVLLSEAQLRAVISQELTGASVEILDFSRYPVPEGKVEFRSGALAPSGLWRGRVVTLEGASAAIWMRVRVTDRATGLPVTLGPSAGVREVNRGDTVRVEVLSGYAVIAYDSVAESSGRAGEMVLISSPDKRRHLLARVEEKGKVSIRR